MSEAKSENWDIDNVGKCEYELQAKITLHYLYPAETTTEGIRRKMLQTEIDFMVLKSLEDGRNKQNIANILLGNNGILI